ncbi:MAG: filamentous hemagglutinin N-terminal domain-containing protein [Nostoc sp. DedQUE05]|uniref:two-partner secretion domain-containing protein n=1 Tax=Nostoc sp. DedQUE05 TaxID=3075391 RepID=UPI002AD470A7|nr:filamentous hemagglutinin N-terminal domain-containing protein [Nostoc sp. DedQUE05]MDZ8093520.1 filamentous hemagglutinin N-terminal domain-containing protein [Nostoc sp. DedQUE05]
MVKTWSVAVTGWLGCVVGIAVSINPTFAQLTPDNSLGKERSQVVPINQNNDRIQGGAARGTNLFHSFQDFNVGVGRGVYFANPEGITNIFSRVTGGNSSNIFGTLGVLGNANLFLLNPNGILFGKNAQLDMQGSFVGTTASSVKFADGREFSATTPQNTPLLTISVPLGLQFGVNPGKITVQGSGHNLTYNPSTAGTIRTDVPGLQVQPGKTLALVGGDINLEGGNLRAESGRIELGSIVSPSLVSLTQNDSGLFLGYSDVNAFGNIQLSQKASADVSGEGGGSIQVQAGKLSMRDGSSLFSITTGSKPGGEFNVNATESIELIGESADKNYASSLNTESQGAGSSGELNVNTGKLIATDGAYISTYTVSSGNGGNLNVKASDSIELFGRGIFGSGFYTGTSTDSSGNAGNLSVEARTLAISEGGQLFASSPGEGNAGNIQIKTDSLQSTNGASIGSSINGKGNGGNITIDANDITFDSDSSIDSKVFADGVGKGGNIRVNTRTLSLLGGSQISTRVAGKGDAGNIFINARDTIQLDGIVGYSIAGITSDVITGGVGNGGNIEITTGLLSLTNGASIDTGTNGIGNAGNITINARETINIDGFGRGFIEQLGEGKLPSGISSDVSFDGVGKGGDIRINTRELFLNNTGEISADTFGLGDGGNIFIQAAETIYLSNINNIDFTEISSTVSSEARGNAGTINIKSRDLLLDNAAINSYTSGQGNAGRISIKVQDTLSLNNQAKFISATSELVGNGGDIDIQTGKLSLDNDSYFFASTSGKGNAGNISIQATDTVSLANNSSIDNSISKTGAGNAGNIHIFAKSFSVSGESIIFNSNLGGKGNAGDISINTKENVSFTDGSFLSNATLGDGNAGNIKIQAGGAVKFSGRSEKLSGGISSSVSKTGVGNSGDIEIVARSLELSNDADLSTLSFGKGNAGNVLITTSGDTTIKDSSIATFIATEGNAGKIAIRAGGDVSISGKSGLSSFLYLNAVGKGGDIEIQGRNFSLSDGAVLYSATAGKGDAGNVLINATGDIFFTNGSNINAATIGQGNAGNVTVNAGGKFSLQGTTPNGFNFDTGIFSIVAIDAGFTGKGEGGNINVTARDLSLNGAALSASSLGDGIAGNININSSAVRLDNKAAISAVTNSSDGGNISLTATDLLLLRRNSNITTTAGLAKSSGDGGNINIDSKFIVASPEENSDISADAYTGSGGRVQINSQGIFGIESRPKPTEKSDITASSQLGISGITNINAPDTSSIQNSFTEASSNVIDTNALIANSCISRSSKQGGTFFITGSGALRNTPGDQLISVYSTGEVRNVEPKSRLWKKGNPIIEAQGVYRLADGQLVLSRECH